MYSDLLWQITRLTETSCSIKLYLIYRSVYSEEFVKKWKLGKSKFDICLFFLRPSFETDSNEASFFTLNPSFSGDIEWEIPRANLNIEKVIGRGAFGVVSRGLALDLPGKPGWTVVAVKSILGHIICLIMLSPNV